MSRLIAAHYQTSTPYQLPIIDWSSIQAVAPTKLPVSAGVLPYADVAIITWTSAEWSALDHVFLNSDRERGPDAYAWREAWVGYPGQTDAQPLLYFQRVSVPSQDGSKDLKVLLVKSEVHLAHPPYISGIERLVNTIVKDSGVGTIISTGTAGGATTEQPLGDVLFTCSAHIRLEKTENIDHCNYNNTTITGDNIFAESSLYDALTEHLTLPMDRIWNDTSIQKAVTELNYRNGTKYSAKDLINTPLEPENLSRNTLTITDNQPLLTTDYYFIAESDSDRQYSFLEMDDAVIGHECQTLGVKFGFIRNVSDPVVVSKDSHGIPLAKDIRGDWSGIVYSLCGFYTTFNSALAAWAAVTVLADNK